MKRSITTIVLLSLTILAFAQKEKEKKQEPTQNQEQKAEKNGGIYNYVDTKAAETLNLAKEYTDQAEADANTYTNQAEADANAYTDQAKTEAIIELKSYTDQAKSEAITESNTYADQAKTEAVTMSNAYTDQSTIEAVTESNSYTDIARSEAVTVSNTYTDQAKTQAVVESNTYTDQVKLEAIIESNTYTNQAKMEANSYTDTKIQETACPLFTWNVNGVGIGTPAHASYKLAVKGKAIFEEVKIELIADWADYVFEPDYNLMTLKDLETYIKINKHLPEIPTTAEVKENGISVGEMNAKLLQKMEELTLYLLGQQKEIEHLKNEVQQLKNK